MSNNMYVNKNTRVFEMIRKRMKYDYGITFTINQGKKEFSDVKNGTYVYKVDSLGRFRLGGKLRSVFDLMEKEAPSFFVNCKNDKDKLTEFCNKFLFYRKNCFSKAISNALKEEGIHKTKTQCKHNAFNIQNRTKFDKCLEKVVPLNEYGSKRLVIPNLHDLDENKSELAPHAEIKSSAVNPLPEKSSLRAEADEFIPNSFVAPKIVSPHSLESISEREEPDNSQTVINVQHMTVMPIPVMMPIYDWSLASYNQFVLMQNTLCALIVPMMQPVQVIQPVLNMPPTSLVGQEMMNEQFIAPNRVLNIVDSSVNVAPRSKKRYTLTRVTGPSRYPMWKRKGARLVGYQ